MVVVYRCLVRQVYEVGMEVEAVLEELECNVAGSRHWGREDSHSRVDRVNVDWGAKGNSDFGQAEDA